MTATIRVRPLGQQWQTIGTLAHRGVWHEGLELASDQWGPKSASFVLKRPANALFPDLLADTPVTVDVAGVQVWAGRVKDTPETSGRDRQLSVECEGWQYHLDDDMYERVYVHTRLADHKDTRTAALDIPLTEWTQAGQVTSDNGAITIGWPSDGTIPSAGVVGVTLDMGPAQVAKRLVLTVDAVGMTTNFDLIARGHDLTSTTSLFTVGGTFDDAFIANNPTSTTYAGNFGAGHRYVTIFLLWLTGATAATTDRLIRIKSAQVFADTAYESGNASVLTGDTVIKDALSRATTLLNPDRSLIGAPGFNFPDFAPSEPQTARQYITAANAPSGWRFKIDEQLRPRYSARPATPVVEVCGWPGVESLSGSSNSTDGIVTEVIVRGTGPDGSPLIADRTQTGTIVDRQGGGRTQTLATSFALNTGLANQLGDVYLQTHRVSPFKGQVTVTPGGCRRVIGGVPVHPAHVLLLTGDLMRRSDLVDPDTGAVGRSITIDQVTYRDDDLAADVALDNTRGDFDALLARLGVLVPA